MTEIISKGERGKGISCNDKKILLWLFGASSYWCIFLDWFLGDITNLLWPLWTFCVGCVSWCLIFTFFFHFCSTLNNIILHIMNFLFGPTLWLILSSTNLRSLDITILDQGSSAYLKGSWKMCQIPGLWLISSPWSCILTTDNTLFSSCLYCLIESYGLILNEAILSKVLLTILFLE